MERMTERDEFGNADIIGVSSCDFQLRLDFDEFNRVTDALNRLAAYEDTGLEPEEVQHWKACLATPTMQHLIEMCEKVEAERDTYRALGTVEELAALVKARDEGRVLVLPEDGMLYHFAEIPETGARWVSNKPIQKITFTCGFGLVGMPFDFSQFGKTVFLTRAEAEAALSVQEGDPHETNPI